MAYGFPCKSSFIAFSICRCCNLDRLIIIIFKFSVKPINTTSDSSMWFLDNNKFEKKKKIVSQGCHNHTAILEIYVILGNFCLLCIVMLRSFFLIKLNREYRHIISFIWDRFKLLIGILHETFFVKKHLYGSQDYTNGRRATWKTCMKAVGVPTRPSIALPATSMTSVRARREKKRILLTKGP